MFFPVSLETVRSIGLMASLFPASEQAGQVLQSSRLRSSQQCTLVLRTADCVPGSLCQSTAGSLRGVAVLVRLPLKSEPRVALPSTRDTRTLIELVGLERDVPICSLGGVQVVWTTGEINHTSAIGTK